MTGAPAGLRSPVLCAAILLAVTMPAAVAPAQDAESLRATASSTIDMAKQVQLYCQAADLVPANKAYRSDCDARKAALINNDRQTLRTALNAFDNGQMAKAKRNAGYVSNFDADTHKQAQDLIAKIDGAGPGGATQVSDDTTALAAARLAFSSGNLAAARAGAQGIKDPQVKPGATQLIAEIDRYAGLVAAGQQQEQAKKFEEAEASYKTAMALNANVASDRLSSRIDQMRTLASANKPQGSQQQNSQPGTQPATQQQAAQTQLTARANTPPPPPQTPEQRLDRLLADGAVAMNRSDLNMAESKFSQALTLAPGNAVAMQRLAEIKTITEKDPVRLEKLLRDAVVAFYDSRFEEAKSGLDRYLGADNGKKKGAAFFYLGATETALSLLDEPSRRTNRNKAALENFKQARTAKYSPVEKYVSARILEEWRSSAI